MSNFFELMKIDDFIQLASKQMNKNITEEIVQITEVLDRIVTKDIFSPVNLPNFTRSVMDGYAVIAKDTYGANENIPVFLECVSEVKMGEEAHQAIQSGQCIKVATGGMLPINANAVVMIEDTEEISSSEIEISQAVAEKDNIVLKGEDLEKGELLLKKGHRIRPQDIGALAGIGMTRIPVYKKLNVAVFSTGDELIPPEKEPALGEIRDINSYAITSFVKQAKANVEMCGIIKDDHETLLNAIKSKLTDYDMILLSGGSSVGTRDLTIQVLETLEKESILAHGVAIKPGKPTILSYIQKTLIIGLPGHPASSIVVFKNVVEPLLQVMSGEINPLQQQSKKVIKAKLNRNIVSDKGRDEFIRVFVEQDNHELIAHPILGKSSLITTLVKANGLLKCPIGYEGISKDEIVTIELFS